MRPDGRGHPAQWGNTSLRTGGDGWEASVGCDLHCQRQARVRPTVQRSSRRCRSQPSDSCVAERAQTTRPAFLTGADPVHLDGVHRGLSHTCHRGIGPNLERRTAPAARLAPETSPSRGEAQRRFPPTCPTLLGAPSRARASLTFSAGASPIPLQRWCAAEISCVGQRLPGPRRAMGHGSARTAAVAPTALLRSISPHCARSGARKAGKSPASAANAPSCCLVARSSGEALQRPHSVPVPRCLSPVHTLPLAPCSRRELLRPQGAGGPSRRADRCTRPRSATFARAAAPSKSGVVRLTVSTHGRVTPCRRQPGRCRPFHRSPL